MSDQDSNESHKLKVREYLNEVIDNGKVDLLDELFTEDCIIHRPEFPEPIEGRENFKAFLSVGLTQVICEMHTTLHDMVAEGDLLACRLTHRATFCKDAVLPSRLGTYKVSERTVTWFAIALCRFRDDKVSEEWVCRDEMGTMLQLGILTPEQ